ncbi:MAG TPA: hypothetical protein DCF84_04905 [Bacteroidetes bacterium]|nr:hypothetical protein [Bacteroidota bacterium]
MGTLYWHEGHASKEVDEIALRKAKEAYLSSIERHPYNSIPWINLASLYAEEGQFEKADKAYENASERAKAREWWFRMHSQWAAMHQQWAMHGWKLKKWNDAEEHFLRAEELFVQSRDIASLSRDKKWVVQYTKLLITHGRFLDAQHKFDEAQKLFAKARVLPNWYWWGRDTKSHYIWSLHTYDHGRHLWHQRRPEEALRLMKQAKKHLHTYHRLLKDDIGKPWHDHMKKVQEIIDFFEKTGIRE